MDEALDFILNSTINGKGSEIFVPKLKAYSIIDVAEALKELFGNFGEEKIPIRLGEKMHETLINIDEIRSTIENKNTYAILNKAFIDEEYIKSKYPDMKKVEEMKQYSSDLAEKISKNELKNLIQNSGLLN